jgi:thioredoxin 1
VDELTDATFEQEVILAETPVIVDFWAPWCGPCHAVEPILRQLEEEYGSRVKFAKVDIDENIQTASRYDVLSIPTAILFEAASRARSWSAPAPARTTSRLEPSGLHPHRLS